MSFFSDLFGGADNAAQAQIAAIQQGQQQAQGNIAQGNQALTTNYTAGLQPFLQNYAASQPGVAQLGNALGLNGPAGSQSALANFETSPGYQFQLGQGDNAINAGAAANGTLNSGNQALALSKFNQGLAGTTANNYISQLTPYLGYSTQGAAGVGGLYSGLGNQLNANQSNLANLNYGAATSSGNAQASADLANQGLGMSLLGGLGSLATMAIPGFGTALGGSSILGSILASDARLKEHIAPVGELYDGLNVYRYNYKGDATPRIGVMAQEVEQKYPAAVADIGGGYKGVDYGKATDYASELGRLFQLAA